MCDGIALDPLGHFWHMITSLPRSLVAFLIEYYVIGFTGCLEYLGLSANGTESGPDTDTDSTLSSMTEALCVTKVCDIYTSVPNEMG